MEINPILMAFILERRWNISFIIASALILMLSFIVASQVNDTRQQVLVLTEYVRALRADLEDIKAHGSPITDRRLSVLEYWAGIK